MNITITPDYDDATENDSWHRWDSTVSESGFFMQQAALDSDGGVVAATRHELVITATGAASGFRTQVLVPIQADLRRLEMSLSDDVNLVGSNRTANAVLGRIADSGVVTVDQLAEWFDTAEDWIAFSRLQRARLLADHGTEFTLSPSGISFVDESLHRAG